MNNNITYNGFITINREVLDKLGLYDKPFIFNIYLRLIERTNYSTGCVYFSKRFAEDNFRISYKAYKSVLNEMISLGLLEEVKVNKGECAKFKVIHYKHVIDRKANVENIEVLNNINVENVEVLNNINKEIEQIEQTESLLDSVLKLNKYKSVNIKDLKNFIENKMYITKLSFEEQCKLLINSAEENVIKDYEIISKI